MQYLDSEGSKIYVRTGKCWKGMPVNSWTEEQRAEVGLFPVPAPELGPAPTEAELAQQELDILDRVLSRGEEDILDALIAKGVLTGNEPELSVVKSNKEKKNAARAKL